MGEQFNEIVQYNINWNKAHPDNQVHFYKYEDMLKHKKMNEKYNATYNNGQTHNISDIGDDSKEAYYQTGKDAEQMNQFEKDAAKTNIVGLGSAIMLPAMAGEFTTYGLLGGASRIAGGMLGSSIGSTTWYLAGNQLDKAIGNQKHTFGKIGSFGGGLLGWGTGSNLFYKNVGLNLGKTGILSKYNTNIFNSDVVGNVLSKETKKIKLDNSLNTAIFNPENGLPKQINNLNSKGKTNLSLLERPSKLLEAERLGIPKGERNQPNNKTEWPFSNWSVKSWFRDATGNTFQYTKADIKTLRSHIPEYIEIEKNAKATGNWLKMPDGSLWEGDPRTWIQFQSKDGAKMLLEHHWTGTSGSPTFSRKQKFPTYTGDVWASTTSPESIAEYARSGKNGDIAPITVEEGIKRWNAYLEKFPENIDDLAHKKVKYDIDSAVEYGKGNIYGLGHVYDVTIPKDIKISPNIDFEGHGWQNFTPEQLYKYREIIPTPYELRRSIPRTSNTASDELILSNKYSNFGATRFSNIHDTSTGPIIDEFVIHADTPRKSLIGNNGDFNLSKLHIYRKQGGKLKRL